MYCILYVVYRYTSLYIYIYIHIHAYILVASYAHLPAGDLNVGSPHEVVLILIIGGIFYPPLK